MVTRYPLLIRNARQVVCMSAPYLNQLSSGAFFKRGPKEMNELHVMEDPEGMDIVVGSDGRIVDICTDQSVIEHYAKEQRLEEKFDQVVDARNCSVVPGFIDCHTHSCYAGDRLNEFVMKLQGATYLEIHKMGGGIHFTVRHTRAASEEDLFADLKKRLLSMLSCGTTTVEVKSGYGLDTVTELKMLRVVNRARRELAGKMDVIATFCGAHAVPQGDNPEDSTNRVINEMLPAILEAKDNDDIKIDGGIDIFCEKGIFENSHTRRILDYGKKLGIRGNFHGDELSCTNSAELGVEMKARSVSHLEEISDAGIAALAKSAETDEPTVGVLLPTTAYLLRLKVPPARRMIDAGGCVALASDFNPNAYCYNMPLVMNMGCVLLKMSPAEALTGVTVNAAAALGLSDSRGSLSRGRLADFVILDSPRWENVIYQVGCSNELIRNVVKAGRVVYTKPTF